MPGLKVVSECTNGCMMLPNVILETEAKIDGCDHGIRINTPYTYEDIENMMKASMKERS